MHKDGVRIEKLKYVDVLGNAHLTNFFVNNGSMEELNLALKAYTQTVTMMHLTCVGTLTKRTKP